MRGLRVLHEPWIYLRWSQPASLLCCSLMLHFSAGLTSAQCPAGKGAKPGVGCHRLAMLAWLAAATARDVYTIVNAPTYDEERGARKVKRVPQSNAGMQGCRLAEEGQMALLESRQQRRGLCASVCLWSGCGPRAGFIALYLPHMLRLRSQRSSQLLRACGVLAFNIKVPYGQKFAGSCAVRPLCAEPGQWYRGNLLHDPQWEHNP